MRVDRFEIVGELARGGLGVVYRAWDSALGREVALKVLQESALGSPVARARFEREAEALRRLRHPNIVPFHGAGEVRGCPYLAMALVDGETLHDRIRRQGTLPPREAARLIHALAQALHHAHLAGVVHRDVKPSNVLMDSSGQPLLTDFGLAGDLTPGSGSKLTRTGMYLGTPGYWAPEQARGRLDEVGPVTDVYALGATLYACLTGVPPVRETSDLGAILTATIKVPPTPPRELSPDVDPALQAICLKALAKAPEDRHPSAEALGWELAGYLAEKPPSRSRLAAGAGVAAVLCLVVGVAALVATDAAPPKPVASATPAKVIPPDPRPIEPTPTAPAPAASTPADPPGPSARALAERHLDKALTAIRADDLEAAAAHYGKAIRADPQWFLPRLKRAGFYEQRKRTGEALLDYEAAVKVAPENPAVYYHRANYYLLIGRPKDALADYDRAHELDPASPSILSNRAIARRRLGDLPGALADCQAALKLNPEDYRALVSRARIRLKLKQPKTALGDLRRALELTPRSLKSLRGDLLALLAKTHLGRQEHALALPFLEELGKLRPVRALFIDRARCYRKLGRLPEAVADLGRALSRTPKDRIKLRAGLHEDRGLLLERLRRYELALAELTQVVRLRPDAKAHVNQGALFSRLGRYAEAIRSYTSALAREPDMINALGNRGSCYHRLKQFVKAIPDLQRAIELKPGFDAIWWSRWSDSLRELGKLQEAVAVAAKAIARFPKSPAARIARGRAYEDLGQTTQAIADLEACLPLLSPGDPRRPFIQKRLAKLRKP